MIVPAEKVYKVVSKEAFSNCSSEEFESLLGWRPSLVGWRPSLLGWTNGITAELVAEGLKAPRLCVYLGEPTPQKTNPNATNSGAKMAYMKTTVM